MQYTLSIKMNQQEQLIPSVKNTSTSRNNSNSQLRDIDTNNSHCLVRDFNRALTLSVKMRQQEQLTVS